MKRILITGANSYVGVSFEDYVKKYPEKYSVDTLDMRSDGWRNYDFSKYDVVFHVAGIVHIKTSKKNKDLYYKVNTELAIETAKKAKTQGVQQFIFMSSMSSMYTCSEHCFSPLVKKTVYGESKLLAEQGITSLANENFIVSTLRPPMVYGKGCKGNYQRLVRLSLNTPVFPDFDNKRSMIYIDNLCEFVRLLIDNKDGGIFFPQNVEYVCTSELVRQIAKIHGKNIKFTKLLNPAIKVAAERMQLIGKIFGDCIYDKKLSQYKDKYQIIGFEDSVGASEL